MSVNSGYGGTAALFNTIAWMESSAWDGRLGIVITTDIAIYPEGPARSLGGAGALALLIAPKAPIIMDPIRSTFMDDVYDLYNAQKGSEFPIFDRHQTAQNYITCLTECYQLLKSKFLKTYNEMLTINSFDQIIFHSPYQKLVKKAFLHLCYLDL
jgi:hydroxymethylglutaryl-CoA synthase